MVCLWEMDTLDLLNTIALPGPVQMLDISIDSMFLLVLCEGNQLWLHALATGTLIHILKGYCSKVMSIALAEDCQRAVVAGVDSRVYIYDIHSGDLDLVPISTSPHHKEVIAVKITNNDDFLVTAGMCFEYIIITCTLPTKMIIIQQTMMTFPILVIFYNDTEKIKQFDNSK